MALDTRSPGLKASGSLPEGEGGIRGVCCLRHGASRLLAHTEHLHMPRDREALLSLRVIYAQHPSTGECTHVGTGISTNKGILSSSIRPKRHTWDAAQRQGKPVPVRMQGARCRTGPALVTGVSPARPGTQTVLLGLGQAAFLGTLPLEHLLGPPIHTRGLPWGQARAGESLCIPSDISRDLQRAQAALAQVAGGVWAAPEDV